MVDREAEGRRFDPGPGHHEQMHSREPVPLPLTTVLLRRFDQPAADDQSLNLASALE